MLRRIVGLGPSRVRTRIPPIDLSETFAPTVSSSCERFLSAMCECECDLDIYHSDIDLVKFLFSLISKRMFFCDCRKDVVIFQQT